MPAELHRPWANCLIYTWAHLEYVIFILWLRSVSKMLLSLKFMEECEFMKNAKIVQIRV